MEIIVTRHRQHLKTLGEFAGRWKKLALMRTTYGSQISVRVVRSNCVCSNHVYLNRKHAAPTPVHQNLFVVAELSF